MKNPNNESEETFLNTMTDAIAKGQAPTPDQLALDQQYADTDPTYKDKQASAFDAGEAAWEKANPGIENPATGLGGTQEVGDGIAPGLSDDDEIVDELLGATGDVVPESSTNPDTRRPHPCGGFYDDDIDEDQPGDDL